MMKLFSNKIFVISICIIIFIIILLLFTNKKDNKLETKLINYINKKDYIVDTGKLYKSNDNNTLLCNEDSLNDCEIVNRFFNISTYEYFINKKIKDSNVYIELIPTYNYKTQEIRYNYRSTYNNGTIIYMGIYNEKDDKFTCELDYSYGTNANKDVICSFIKNEIVLFNTEAKMFITDSYLLKNMQK